LLVQRGRWLVLTLAGAFQERKGTLRRRTPLGARIIPPKRPSGQKQQKVGAGCKGYSVKLHEVGQRLIFWTCRKRTDLLEGMKKNNKRGDEKYINRAQRKKFSAITRLGDKKSS